MSDLNSAAPHPLLEPARPRPAMEQGRPAMEPKRAGVSAPASIALALRGETGNGERKRIGLPILRAFRIASIYAGSTIDCSLCAVYSWLKLQPRKHSLGEFSVFWVIAPLDNAAQLLLSAPCNRGARIHIANISGLLFGPITSLPRSRLLLLPGCGPIFNFSSRLFVLLETTLFIALAHAEHMGRRN
jgi:hypothetical protein